MASLGCIYRLPERTHLPGQAALIYGLPIARHRAKNEITDVIIMGHQSGKLP
jgi:hypothetical protein